MSTGALQHYQTELLEQAEEVGALKFGAFTLKSGRISPYFFNAGLMSSGKILNTIANAYAATIIAALESPTNPLPAFDIIFGPAYKGISLAACTALVLSSRYGRSYGFAYDRKEVKDHGEGGKLVGVPVQGKRVLILDDVMTSGTAIRIAIESIRSGEGEAVGVVQLLDREEIGKEGGSTVDEVEILVGGKGRVQSVLIMFLADLNTLMSWNDKTPWFLQDVTIPSSMHDLLAFNGFQGVVHDPSYAPFFGHLLGARYVAGVRMPDIRPDSNPR